MEYISILLLLAVIGLLIRGFNGIKKNETDDRILEIIRQEMKDNRMELMQSLKENREEIANSFDKLTMKLDDKLSQLTESMNSAQKSNRDEMTASLERMTGKMEDKLKGISEITALSSKESREELSRSLKEFSESFSKSVNDFNAVQKEKFEAMEIKQNELVKATEEKLERMRETVDEKLHKTLEERLGQSFKLVSERLEAVQKGLGEMQTLANGVGDLKKVLTNVKTRGVLGEIQLGSILEQIMAPEQYEQNVKTKAGSNDLVEYAIKLPGKDNEGKEVWLPVDAKFPSEDYVRLQAAYDDGDLAAIDSTTKSLIQTVKKFARDIRDKYIDPPYTTDFGIMFLPIEGLFAEIVRQPDLVALLQREYKIIITGPTTLAAMLNSLQMGFRTLAIQKRSSEVWQILGAVKTEFVKFGDVLSKAQKKINEANQEIDTLVGTRTRLMLSKLKKVEELPVTDSKKILPETVDVEEVEE